MSSAAAYRLLRAAASARGGAAGPTAWATRLARPQGFAAAAATRDTPAPFGTLAAHRPSALAATTTRPPSIVRYSTTPHSAFAADVDDATAVTTTNTDGNDAPHPLDILFRDSNTLTGADADLKVGRSWRASELRLKSFEDLHTLWFALLRERNKLETERFAAKKAGTQMSNPARLRKTRVSMARLKTVLAERSKAYKEAQRATAASSVKES